MMIKPDSLWNLESLSDSELTRRCQRALFASSRVHWHGPRAELRRRVRGFLRKRRRDRASMISILRGVAASSLFAVALLGLDARPAQAAAPEFTLDAGGFDIGGHSVPALADLDGDGDLDLISGEYYGSFLYYENTGSPSSATWTQRTGASNPLDGFDIGYYSSPTFADLDDDGDLDLVAGAEPGSFSYFENTGSALSPAFTPRTGLDNPLDDFSTAAYSAPQFADLDGDGDLDLLAGEGSGALLYFENTGNASSPSFVARTGSANPLDGLGGNQYSVPAFADLDTDGDLDLVVGEYVGTFAYFENTGSSLSPAFVARTGVDNPLDGFDLGYNAAPAFGDFDSDGDFDIVAGEYEMSRRITNTTPATNPNFTEAIGAENPLDGFLTYGYSAPTLADLDDDGDLDIVSGDYYGVFLYFENTGLPAAPAYTELTGAANPFDGLGAGGYYSTPALADLDDDGDLDMVSGSYDGAFAYFENTGSAISPAFVERTGTANPLDGLGVGYFSVPALVDLDGDGDFDLASGEDGDGGIFRYFENTGSLASPSFVERTGASNPLDGFAVNGFSTPNFVDLDGDGDPDLVSGDASGVFFYYENTGTALSPTFETREGVANPFVALSAGLLSTPAMADIDGDGALDLVSGESTGSFVTYLPEPQLGMAVAAGSTLLGLFGRMRRKNR